MTTALNDLQYLVCLHVVSGGQNGENLGSDEEEIVMICYSVFSLRINEVIGYKYFYTKPDCVKKSIITEECRIQTGLNDAEILSGTTLHNAVQIIENDLHDLKIDTNNGLVITDGQLHLRMSFIPELTKKNIGVPNIFKTFCDLRKIFRSCFREAIVLNSLKDMINYLKLESKNVKSFNIFTLDQCNIMAIIISRLVAEGAEFDILDIITDTYDVGLCNKSDVIEENTIVRARGLPWQTTEQDIVSFFAGLSIFKGGIALCLSNVGRRNGEALVRFATKEHRDLALKRHKHHIGHRYIEIYRASVDEFLLITTSDCNMANDFLYRQIDKNQIIVRMRGLPFNCTYQQVLNFFSSEPCPVKILDDKEGILFVQNGEGKSTGDAFVLFASESEAHMALLKHRQSIGSRYIELFRSTSAEVQQVLNKYMEPEIKEAQAASVLAINNLENYTTFCYNADLCCGSGFYLNNGLSPSSIYGCNSFTGNSNNSLSSFSNFNNISSLIILRKMSEEATVSDILLFMGDYCKFIVFQGIHLIYNVKGICSGEALIQIDSEYNAKIIVNAKNKKKIFIKNKKFIIDACLYSDYDSIIYEESNQALNNANICKSQLINDAKIPYQFVYYLPQSEIFVGMYASI